MYFEIYLPRVYRVYSVYCVYQWTVLDTPPTCQSNSVANHEPAGSYLCISDVCLHASRIASLDPVTEKK